MDFVPLFYLFVHLRLYSQLIFEYSRKPFQSKKYSQMWKRATPGKWAGAFMNLCFAPKSSYPYTFQNIPQQQWNKSKFIFWVN